MQPITKFYLKMVALAIVTAAIYGVLVPALVSAPDTVYAIAGGLSAALFPVLAIWYIRRSKMAADAKAVASSASEMARSVRSKLPLLLGLIILGPMFGGCTSVPAGNVLVVVNKYGGDKGVDVETRGPGRYWLGWNQEGHLFPTFTQNYTWEKGGADGDESISFQTREGMAINTDVGISYAVKGDMAHIVFAKYRKGVEEITDIYLRNMVRDALVREGSRLSVEAVYGEGKSDLMAAVENSVRNDVAPLGIIIENVYWIGQARLPDAVIEALNAKISATQKAQQRENEIQQTKAEAQKAIEEARGLADSLMLKATAEAKANELVAKSITPELVRYRALDKWNGELPRLTGGAVPFIDITETTKGKP